MPQFYNGKEVLQTASILMQDGAVFLDDQAVGVRFETKDDGGPQSFGFAIDGGKTFVFTAYNFPHNGGMLRTAEVDLPDGRAAHFLAHTQVLGKMSTGAMYRFDYVLYLGEDNASAA